MLAWSDPALLAWHAGATWALVGLVWTIQVVHYPLFARIGAAEFSRYHAEHMRRITWIVAPLMVAEAVLAALLVTRPIAAVPAWARLTGAALVVFVWVTTALVQAPLHARLAREPGPALQARLVRSNWVRTATWSARGALAAWMVALGSAC